MKILMAGANSKYAIENHYRKYLPHYGGEVSLFESRTLFYTYYSKLINRIVFKMGLSAIYKNINQGFIDRIDQVKPDLIWVFKGMEITPASLRYAKAKKIKLVNYNPDNPFVFSGKGSGNINVTTSIGLYDLHLTYDHAVKKRIESDFNLPVQLLPFGFELNQDVYEACEKLEEKKLACFIGNPDADRASFILQLANRGCQFHLYGYGWNKFVHHENIKIFDAVSGEEFWKTLRSYRVQLNIMRLHNPDSHNMRTFEIPAVGGIQLAPDTPDHRAYFQPDREIFLYKNVEECANRIRQLLELNGSEIVKLRNAARQRSLEAGYSYESRARQVMEFFRQLR